MSYFLNDIKIYPNVLNYHLTSRDTALNYDPEAEPSASGEQWQNSDESAMGSTIPLFDLVDNKLGSIVTIDTNAQSTSPQIDFDLTTNATINTVIIGNHNLATANADFYIKHSAGPTTCTVSSAYSGAQAITGEWHCNTVTVTANLVTVATDGVVLANVTEFTSDNLIIDIDANAPGTFSGTDLTMGEICFCKKWTSPHAPEVPDWADGSSFGGTSSESRGGGAYGNLFYGERKELDLTWKHMSQSDYDDLKRVFRQTKGTVYPFWIDLGEHATLPYLRFVKFTRELVGKPMAGGLYWNVSISIKEVV